MEIEWELVYYWDLHGSTTIYDIRVCLGRVDTPKWQLLRENEAADGKVELPIALWERVIYSRERIG